MEVTHRTNPHSKRRFGATAMAAAIGWSTFGLGSAAAAASYPYPNAPDCSEMGSDAGCVPDSWSFFQGQCTSWVAWKLNTVNGVAFNNSYGGVQWGDASNWDDAARAVGIAVDGTPGRGAVAQWNTLFHVAYVESVNSDASIVISDMNFDLHNGIRTAVTLRPGDAMWPDNFIHVADIVTPPPPPPPPPPPTGVDDLYVIKQAGSTGTELHVLSGKNPQKWLLHSATPLGSTGEDWEFAVGNYNNDGVDDLYVIKQAGSTGTELHVLSGKNPQKWLLHSATPLGSTGEDWEFAVGNYNNDGVDDLYVIKQAGSTGTELHVLSGKNPQKWLLHSATPLGSTGEDWEFAVGNYNNDGVDDLYVIKQAGSTGTELHVLSGKNPQKWLLHSATPLGSTGEDWEFAVGN